MRLIAVCLFALLAGASAVQSSELFKWVDENGVVHYSNTPTSMELNQTETVEQMVEVGIESDLSETDENALEEKTEPRQPGDPAAPKTPDAGNTDLLGKWCLYGRSKELAGETSPDAAEWIFNADKTFRIDRPLETSGNFRLEGKTIVLENADTYQIVAMGAVEMVLRQTDFLYFKRGGCD